MRTSYLARTALVAGVVAACLCTAPALAHAAAQRAGSERVVVPSRPTSRVFKRGPRLTFGSLAVGLIKTTANAWAMGSTSDWRWQNPKPTGLALGDVLFIDSTTGWADGYRTMLKTVDGGVTWTPQDVGPDFEGGKLAFADATHGWCAGGPGDLLRTQDGGAHWEDCDIHWAEGVRGWYSTNGVTDLAFPTASIGYVAMDQRIHKTTDGGATWKALARTGDTWPLGLDFIDTNTGWAVGDTNAVLKTTDGGATWSEKIVPVSDPYSGLGSVDFVDANVGWVAGYEGLFKTTDGGNTWRHDAAINDEYEISSIHFIDRSHGWVTSEGPWATWSGKPFSIWRTEDGGAHWARVDLGMDGAINGVSFIDAEHGWAAGGGGPLGCLLGSTTDGGKTWSSVTTGTGADLYDVTATGADTAIAAGADGTILRTVDGGDTWAPRAADTSQTLWALASVGTSETWVVGEGGTIRHTTDGGDTWAPQSTEATTQLGNVWFEDAQHGWITGRDGTLLETSDGGDHWAAIPTAPKFDLYNVQFFGDAGWVVADASPALYKTTDGGLTWKALDPPLWVGHEVDNIAFADALHGWVAGGDGEILYTSDGGATWTMQYTRTDTGYRVVHAIDADSAIAVTDSGQIARTDDAGVSWWLQVAPGGHINDVDFADNNTGWVVGDRGLIAKTSNGGGMAPLPSRLSGTVRSAASNAPLAGVAVSLETYPVTHTDAAGHYSIQNIMPGIYWDMKFYKPGYALGTEPYVLFVDDDQEVVDIRLTAKSTAKLTSARSVHGKLAASGVVTPSRKATVTLAYYRLVGKTFVRKGSVKVRTASSGKFSYSRKLAKGTWRVRVSVPSGNGYTSAVSAWKVVKVR